MTPTVMYVTNAIGNGTTSTYTFTLSSGSAPIIGVPVIIVGCTTPGFNGKFVINGGNLTTTFTVLSATNHASEAESATATIDLESFALVPSVLSQAPGIALIPFNSVTILAPYANAGAGNNSTGIGQISPTAQA